jgi:hypothetical protein
MRSEDAYLMIRVDTESSSERSLCIYQITKDNSMLKTARAQ